MISMELFALEFELEEFGQNVSHLIRKTYYTHDFFTDRQVHASITKEFDLLGRSKYEYKIVPCTLAIPLKVDKKRIWFSTINVDFQKEKTGGLTYITEGYQEYLAPGSRFLAFSFIKPEQKAIFIGKKGALASIDKVSKVNYKIVNNSWTSLDLVYLNDYEKFSGSDILEVKLKDASQRFLIGQFRCAKTLETEYNDQKFRFYTILKSLE